MVATPPTTMKMAAIKLRMRKLSEMSRAMDMVAAREKDGITDQISHVAQKKEFLTFIAIDDECTPARQ